MMMTTGGTVATTMMLARAACRAQARLQAAPRPARAASATGTPPRPAQRARLTYLAAVWGRAAPAAAAGWHMHLGAA